MKIVKYYRVGANPDPNSFTRGNPQGLTIANVLENGDIALGFSFCSPQDHFDRHKAYLISEGRLASGKFVIPQDVLNSPNLEEYLSSDLTGHFVSPKTGLPTFGPMIKDIIWVAKEAYRRFLKNKSSQT